MTASVVSLSDYAARFVRRPLSDEQMVQRRVRDALKGKVHPRRLAQAEARAARLVAANLTQARILERVIPWALSADDPNDTPPFAA